MSMMDDCNARALTPLRKSSIAVLSSRLGDSHEPFDVRVEGLFCFDSRRFRPGRDQFKSSPMWAEFSSTAAAILCCDLLFRSSNGLEGWRLLVAGVNHV